MLLHSIYTLAKLTLKETVPPQPRTSSQAAGPGPKRPSKPLMMKHEFKILMRD